ncbi:histone-lysine N-methyltransferase SETMAR [Trichonephila clavipes]|nr:histone-lysine N-methyltransferase SETMAR [Trichonephila clavipes]
MATNTSQDVGSSGLGHIEIRTRRVNFKTRHMPLSSSISTAKPLLRYNCRNKLFRDRFLFLWVTEGERDAVKLFSSAVVPQPKQEDNTPLIMLNGDFEDRLGEKCINQINDEAHFRLNGYVNKQNCRIWSEANPQVYVETPLHPEKLTVCCALWAGGIIGLYFFKNDEGHNVTELWFQQDGATCHTARAPIDLLKDTFGDRLISRFGPVNWPPRSCDLTPLDYFLWGYVKSLVYADKPQTLDHLEDNIRRVIADIRPQMLEKVIENWTSRLDYIRASRGSTMPEIIFKM